MKSINKIIFTLAMFCNLSAMAAIHNVSITSNTFTPSVLNIEAGDTVIFTNNGGFHNVEADDGSFRCSTDCRTTAGGTQGQASSAAWVAEITFDSVGQFNYFCVIHGSAGGGGMSGVINVVAPTTAIVHEVRSTNLVFTPNDLTINQGDFVNFINDIGFHNVLADDNSFQCSQVCLGGGKNLTSVANSANWSVFLKFDTLGDIPYFCEQHGGVGGSGMAGIIRVIDPDVIFTNGFE